MRVGQDTFLIQVGNSKNSAIKIKGLNGQEILVDTDYNKYKHSVQIGRIYALPITISAKYDNSEPLTIGDIVVFHHFVCQPDHKVPIGENVYRAEMFHIYAKIEEEQVKPLEDIIFVEPILEAKENMFAGTIQLKSEQSLLPQQGIVFAASKKAKEKGVLVGDKVYFTGNADYWMKIVDKNMYRMRVRNIVAIERSGELICLEDKILVKEEANNEPKKLFCEESKLQKNGEIIKVGKEIKGLDEGQKISFVNGIHGSVNHTGNNYSFVELRHINYIIK
jgi:co-chaperonin GroES (HSP10)